MSTAELESPAIPEPVSFTREYDGKFNGQAIRYRAIAGETHIRDENGKPLASFFALSYLRSDVDDLSQRPVTFLFNGGPTSPAHWLHMGAFGPKLIDVPSDAKNVGAAPYSIVDNTCSMLDASDLVFIDPIGTGFSRPLGGKESKEFWGLLEDARSVADFVQAWLAQHQRWNSPKYLAGESYGTVRASLVAEILATRSTALNGVVLISPVQDYQSCRPRPGDAGILSYVSFLPTFAAIAWYHGKIDKQGRTLQSFLDEVRTFARTDYALALIANTRLPENERAKIAARVAAYSGLKKAYVEQSKLRIPVNRFFKELLRDEGVVIGRLDARYLGTETDSAGEECEADPSAYGVSSAFHTAIQTQLDELGVKMERPYLLNKLIDKVWNWLLEEKAPNGGGFINVIPYLARAMRRNDELRVLATMGYYDLATPFFGAESALTQDGLAHERISFTYYEVGHMIFLHQPSRERFLQDVRKFILEGSTKSAANGH